MLEGKPTALRQILGADATIKRRVKRALLVIALVLFAQYAYQTWRG